MSGPTGNRIADFLQAAAGPRGIKPEIVRPDPDGFTFGNAIALAVIAAIGFGVYMMDQDRQHSVKVCLAQMGLGQTIFDPGVSQHCKDVLADEIVRQQEAGK